MSRRLWIMPMSGGSSNAVTAPLGTETLTGLLPSINQGNVIAGLLGVLTLTGLQPSIPNFMAAAPQGVATLTGLVPSLNVGGAVTSPLGVATLTGLQPSIAPAPRISLRAPFFTTDTVPGPVTVQLYKWNAAGSAVVTDGGAQTTSVQLSGSIANSYIIDAFYTPNADGSYQGYAVWNSGGTLIVDGEVILVPATELDMTQPVPTSNPSQTVGDALNAARAQGFGKWAIVGTTLTLYAADGVTAVRTFTLDSSTAPTTRT